jgi:integrase
MAVRQAARFGRIPTNPVKAVEKPKAKRGPKPNAIGRAEVERIRSNLRDGDAVFVSVLAYAGLRPGEARALQWRDVGKRLLAVERAVDDSGELKPTKTEHERAVRC